jgi:S-layer homology domain
MKTRLLSLSILSVLLVSAAPALADSVQKGPYCDAEGSRSEGWYSSEGRIKYAQCEVCTAVCSKIGTKSEGWYSSCNSELIRFERCGAQTGFSDVPPAHIYAEEVLFLKNMGIVSGYSDGTYKPGVTINRAEFAKIVIRAQYSQEAVDQCLTVSSFLHPGVFEDVPADAWYVPYLCLGTVKGVIAGNPDGTFRGESTINFAEAAKILALTFDTPTPKPVEGTVWYKPYIEGLRLMNALPSGYKTPDQAVTRGEMAFMIHAFLSRMIDESPMPTDIPVVGEGCKVSGCSATICQNESDEEMVTTCEWREEYACYQHATCEKQNDGQCGWTPTEQLDACIMDAK